MCISSEVEAFDGPSDRWIWNVVGGVLGRQETSVLRRLRFGRIVAYQELYEVLYSRMVREELDVDSVDVGGCAEGEFELVKAYWK